MLEDVAGSDKSWFPSWLFSESELGVKGMAGMHPPLYQTVLVGKVVDLTAWGIFSPSTLASSSQVSIAQTRQATWVLFLTTSAPLWPPCLLMATFNRIACHVTKLQPSQSAFWNMTMYSNGLHLNPIDHLWDLAEPESRIAPAHKSAGSPRSCHVRADWGLWGTVFFSSFFLFLRQLVESVPPTPVTCVRAK